MGEGKTKIYCQVNAYKSYISFIQELLNRGPLNLPTRMVYSIVASRIIVFLLLSNKKVKK